MRRGGQDVADTANRTTLNIEERWTLPIFNELGMKSKIPTQKRTLNIDITQERMQFLGSDVFSGRKTFKNSKEQHKDVNL